MLTTQSDYQIRVQAHHKQPVCEPLIFIHIYCGKASSSCKPTKLITLLSKFSEIRGGGLFSIRW